MNTEHIHTCSYQCERPECIRAQRDELAAKQGFTAADMADQAATAFERGRESVLAELHAAAPATYFPLTLRGLIAYGQVAADPSQGAGPNHMRYLIEQMVPHLKRLDEIESSTPAAPGIDASPKVGSERRRLE